ncbi:hypothetical protein THAOC_04092, partial [Thalassiosira oceanica]
NGNDGRLVDSLEFAGLAGKPDMSSTLSRWKGYVPRVMNITTHERVGFLQGSDGRARQAKRRLHSHWACHENDHTTPVAVVWSPSSVSGSAEALKVPADRSTSEPHMSACEPQFSELQISQLHDQLLRGSQGVAAIQIFDPMHRIFNNQTPRPQLDYDTKPKHESKAWEIGRAEETEMMGGGVEDHRTIVLDVKRPADHDGATREA